MRTIRIKLNLLSNVHGVGVVRRRSVKFDVLAHRKRTAQKTDPEKGGAMARD